MFISLNDNEKLKAERLAGETAGLSKVGVPRTRRRGKFQAGVSWPGVTFAPALQTRPSRAGPFLNRCLKRTVI